MSADTWAVNGWKTAVKPSFDHSLWRGPLEAPLDDGVVRVMLRAVSLSMEEGVCLPLGGCGKNLGQILGDYQR